MTVWNLTPKFEGGAITRYGPYRPAAAIGGVWIFGLGCLISSYRANHWFSGISDQWQQWFQWFSDINDHWFSDISDHWFSDISNSVIRVAIQLTKSVPEFMTQLMPGFMPEFVPQIHFRAHPDSIEQKNPCPSLCPRFSMSIYVWNRIMTCSYR